MACSDGILRQESGGKWPVCELLKERQEPAGRVLLMRFGVAALTSVVAVEAAPSIDGTVVGAMRQG